MAEIFRPAPFSLMDIGNVLTDLSDRLADVEAYIAEIQLAFKGIKEVIIKEL